jgi:hypothetical protein
VTRVRATSVGFVFQTFNLVPTLSAQENVEAALVPLHVSVTARRQRAAVTLDTVGLGDRLRHVPGEPSGGQQRVAIARALVKEPKVLPADEPTGNLDEDTRDEIIGLLEAMWRERGLTMVVVTYDSTVARRAPAHRRDEERPPELQAAGPSVPAGRTPLEHGFATEQAGQVRGFRANPAQSARGEPAVGVLRVAGEVPGCRAGSRS